MERRAARTGHQLSFYGAGKHHWESSVREVELSDEWETSASIAERAGVGLRSITLALYYAGCAGLCDYSARRNPKTSRLVSVYRKKSAIASRPR
jgi:hypothetical protein